MLIPPAILAASSLAASNLSAIVCTAGQCLQGYSNTTIGVTISVPGTPSALLLPGQYTSTTNPELLHNLLTSSSATLMSSPGFKNSTTSLVLPLNVAQEPGLSIYSGSFYSGDAGFTTIPSAPIRANSSSPLTARSLTLSSSVWISVNSPASPNSRVIIWDSIPDTSELPTSAPSTLTLFDIESAACSPPCASSGICTAAGTCACAPGFTGASCDTCAPGFFGPSCTACPSGCTDCDDGLTGSGRCLNTVPPGAPATCNCVNGVCAADGSCTCTTGFTKAANGTACSACAPGFFLTSAGDCSVCGIGCTACADGSGECTTCETGFTPDGNDHTQCIPPQSIASDGTVCPPGAFSAGANCAACSNACKTCTGGTANDCVQCAAGTYLLNGTCVSADANGVCAGSSLIADNDKLECDSCGAKCTSCKIPNFNSVSTVNQLQCTGCIPGFFLSDGHCVESCPAGTFVSPQDNVTCTACDSSCSTCVGSATFCLTCSSNQLASSGKCVPTCPSNTFSASGSCLTCHPDCASCSSGSFNQCTSCPSSRPVLTNGRCLPTCSKNQFFDPTTSTCIACDSSCSSCSGAGPSQCLACASNTQVLRAGTCVAAACQQSSSVIPGLGACLSDFVDVASATAPGAPPLPSVSGISSPTVVSTRRPLEWWEILLMALGCAFIFLIIVWLWRRRARKNWAKQTEQFAAQRRIHRGGWLVRLGKKLFGHRANRRTQSSLRPLVLQTMGGKVPVGELVKTDKMCAAEEGRDMDTLLASYQYPRSRVEEVQHHHHHHHLHVAGHERHQSGSSASTLSAPSLYSQVTGVPRRVPEPREPVREHPHTERSRFSNGSSIDEYYLTTAPYPPPPPPPTSKGRKSLNPFRR